MCTNIQYLISKSLVFLESNIKSNYFQIEPAIIIILLTLLNSNFNVTKTIKNLNVRYKSSNVKENKRTLNFRKQNENLHQAELIFGLIEWMH